MLWLLFNRDCLSVVVEFYDTKTFRIIYIIAEYCRTFSRLCIFHGRFQTLLQAMTCEYIISQNHCNGIVTNEVCTNNKCLCQSIRAWLNCIRKIHTILVSISQQFLKSRCILWCRDNQDITDTCIHQYRHRIIDHRFIINR